jgi:hypothetical protein
MSKTALWISGITLLISALGIVPAYVVFFDKADLIYEMRIEQIHLPRNLPGQLPDSLVIVTIENVGRRPSIELQGNLKVGGELIDYQVQGPNPAYGQVSSSRNNLQIAANCPRLAPGNYPIRISAWYRGASSEPDAGVSDSNGPGRRVNSIDAEKSKYKQLGSLILGLLAGSLGSFVAILGAVRMYKTKRSISEAARELQENVNVETGTAGVGDNQHAVNNSGEQG